MSQLQQFYRSPETNRTYLITDGQTIPVDSCGQSVRRFYQGVSGTAHTKHRYDMALKGHDRSVLPEISDNIKIKEVLVPKILKEMNLNHFLPTKIADSLPTTVDLEHLDALRYLHKSPVTSIKVKKPARNHIMITSQASGPQN